MIGSKIEHYRIVDILGEGGMGIVYKALDLKLERYVALKILNAQAFSNPQFIARFRREAKNQAKLTHPNIVPVYGLAESENTLGIVMEYVKGETLERIIERERQLGLIESLNILKQILAGAGYAHKQGFVHRDLKPSNIIINHEGVAKIMDFGISKSINDSKAITKTGTKIGTVLYMSPEQIKAQDPTNRSDIYSIGITFYEMLAGVTPFDKGTEFEIMEAHLKKNPVKISSIRKDIPFEVDALINKALNKSPIKRYENCDEFIESIDDLLYKLETGNKKIKKIKTKKRKKKTVKTKKTNFKSRFRFAFLAVLFLALFGGLFYFVYSTVSDYWKDAGRLNKDITNENISYQSAATANTQGWRTVDNPNVKSRLNSAVFIDDNNGVVCGNNGTILKTGDGGLTWNKVDIGTNLNLWKVFFNKNNTGFILGEKGLLLSSADSGGTWREINSNTAETLFDIYFNKEAVEGLIVGGKGKILKTVDGGNTWNKIDSPTSNLLYSIAFADENNGFIVGWNGTVLKTSDRGTSWQMRDKLGNSYLRDINFNNSAQGIIVGGGGEIFYTGNGGTSWDKVESNTIAGLYAVKFIDNENGYITGGKGEILKTADAGKSWSQVSSGRYVSFFGAASTPSKKIFIIGDNGTILTRH